MSEKAKLIGAVALIWVFGAAGANASSIVPAEVPPASYSASQYVDSKGCIFVRAGSGGAVRWIPRMDRARNQMCNGRPSLSAQAATPAPTTRQTSASVPEIQITAPRSVPASQVTIPVTGTAPVLTPRVQTTTRTTTTGRRQASACPGASPLSRQYINFGQHGPVRCGPQPVHPADVVRGTRTGALGTGGAGGSSVGGAPFEPVNANPRVPAGYRTAWTDGRLNPNRGGTSLSGSGTAYASAETGTSTTVRARVSTRTPEAAAVTRSTRTAPRAPEATAPGRNLIAVNRTHRFVQVGTYGQPANTERAIRALQRLGLPVARTGVTRGGTRYDVVLAGPFGTPTELGRALVRTQSAGFRDAFTRK